MFLILENSVLIFDEAHNIETIAEEGASYKISNDIITAAMDDIKNIVG